jgi:hypothetical protein
MQKITVMGEDSAAKNAVIIALNSTLQITDLCPNEASVNSIRELDLVIYVAEAQPDQQNFERLRKGCKGLILISRARLAGSDLFIPIGTFKDFSAKRVLEQVQTLRDFIDDFFPARIALNDIQRSVISQLSKSSSEKEALSKLAISRRTYYEVLSQLRALYGVGKNWQLVHLFQNMRQARKG